MLKLFSFDAAHVEEHSRLTAWQDALAGLGLNSLGDATPRNFRGSFLGVRAPWGFSLTRLHLSAQHLSVETEHARGGIWLARIGQGMGTLRTERGSIAFAAGDMIVGKVPREFRLSAKVETCVDYVQFNDCHHGSRLSAFAAPSVALPLATDQGPATFLADLLELAAGRIGTITSEEVRPLEITLLEFLMAAVASTGAASSVIAGSRSRNATALRAKQAIEMKLSDPDLTPSLLADELGISLRYLQKLFEDAGENTTHYIRRRRLERSYQDLADPLYAALSIADISYRWGFNDSAYFSRAFRERYGMSPSQHRGNWRWHEPRWPKVGAETHMVQDSGLRPQLAG